MYLNIYTPIINTYNIDKYIHTERVREPIYTLSCSYIYIYIYIYIYTYIHTYIHTYTRLYIYIYIISVPAYSSQPPLSPPAVSTPFFSRKKEIRKKNQSYSSSYLSPPAVSDGKKREKKSIEKNQSYCDLVPPLPHAPEIYIHT